MFSESEKDRKFRQIKLWVDKVFRRWDSNQDGQVKFSSIKKKSLEIFSSYAAMI